MLDGFRGEWAVAPDFKRLWDKLSAFRKDFTARNEKALLARPGTVRAE